NLRREIAGPQKRLVFSGGCRDCPALLRFRLARSCRAGIADRRSAGDKFRDAAQARVSVIKELPVGLAEEVAPECSVRKTRLAVALAAVAAQGAPAAAGTARIRDARLLDKAQGLALLVD